MKRALSVAFALLAIGACTKAPEGVSERNYVLKGYAQKGQFIKGSQVTAFAVGEDLVATGESFPANISDDLGSFAISVKTTAPYMELRAEGYYFNEIKGEVSSSPLYLEAFVKSNDNSANINLMTTAIRPRIKALLADGKSFDKAVEQAQSELFQAIGFSNVPGDFDDMDITGDSNADAALLAFACLIQNQRNESQVTQTIQKIASDLADDGKLSEEQYTDIWKYSGMDAFRIAYNISNYYKQKGLQVTSLPMFCKFLNPELPGDLIVMGKSSETIESPDASDVYFRIFSSVDFSAESDVEGFSYTKENIIGTAYLLSCSIPANSEPDDRTIAIRLKSSDGKTLYETSIKQSGAIQYLKILPETTTKSISGCSFHVGDVVSVNGTEYALAEYEEGIGVKVPRADSYIVTYPADKVTDGGRTAFVTVSLDAESGKNAQIYYYGRAEGNEVVMKPCTAGLKLVIADDYKNDWKYLDIKPVAEGKYLSGKGAFVVEDWIYNVDPNLNYYKIFYEESIRTRRIINDGTDGDVYTLMFPLELEDGFTVELYGQSSELLTTAKSSSYLTFERGKLYTFKQSYKYVSLVSIESLGSAVNGETL